MKSQDYDIWGTIKFIARFIVLWILAACLVAVVVILLGHLGFSNIFD